MNDVQAASFIITYRQLQRWNRRRYHTIDTTLSYRLRVTHWRTRTEYILDFGESDMHSPTTDTLYYYSDPTFPEEIVNNVAEWAKEEKTKWRKAKSSLITVIAEVAFAAIVAAIIATFAG